MKRFGSALLVLILSLIALVPAATSAATSTSSGFSLQVSPSPIVQTVKPGDTTTIEVHIRNTGTATEQLKIGLRAFAVDNATGNVTLKDTSPKDVEDWVTFSDPTFSVTSGTSFTQHVTFAVPGNAGFNYSFAILISRSNPTTGAPGKTAIEGSVAIFTLLTVDRPDATRKIDVVSFSSKKKVYEFLPSEFTLQLKNSGNTIIAPTGNIFIQKSATSTTPMAILSVNANGAYVLPNVTRSVTSKWSDGFPVYKTDNGKSHLDWNWGMLQKLRIGHYVAKAIVIYNDGTRDIPVEATVSFWVIPWRLLLGVFIVLLLIIVGIVTLVRKTAKLAPHKKEKEKEKDGHEKA